VESGDERATDLAALLAGLRRWRGLSKIAAANAAGVQPATVARLERVGSDPRISTLCRYAAGLGGSVELVVRDRATGEAVGRVTLPALDDPVP